MHQPKQLDAAQLYCRYAGKKCQNRRALKRNGRLHSLCDFHRKRANRVQRNSDRRRRMLLQQRQVTETTISPSVDGYKESKASNLCADDAKSDEGESLDPTLSPVALEPFDLVLLQAFFTDDGGRPALPPP
ncbi:TPA: hypothetical protein N0F65_000628 [Lagenidium giganteum]|uniref:Uncharacterized protein n=1 Tax=Lagenidium giganteum TaxID=4803 RepID=A0AAV2YLI6_9STRA|nr:TPA: hypothetical protein N0F65_000628 [Lagenidium giganteum]